MNIAELYELYRNHPSVQTDTRKLQKNDLFFALKGPNFNANAFAAAALGAGASYAVIDDPAYHTGDRTILVDDTLNTLQQLALHHRNQFTIPVLAITGSNGKTTTKELIHAVLSTTFTTYTTAGNLNNHIGVPLTLLSIRPGAEMAVIEMGANHIGEIASYCRYTLPTHGLITNIGKAHLEGFGSLEGVKKGKSELFDHLRRHQGTAFVMRDYPELLEVSIGIPRIVTYGSSGADVNGRLLASQPFLQVRANDLDIHTQLVGEYNLPNVLAAVAVGKHFGVNDTNIRLAIAGYSPGNSRSQLVEKDSNRFVLDAYNANPTSMKAAIENFAKLPDPGKVLILGAMAELGAETEQEHRELLALIARFPWKEVVLVGEPFLRLAPPFPTFRDSLEAAEWFHKQGFRNTCFLVKGSRSTRMERILEQPPNIS